ncbi:transcription-repair coupling factor [Caldicellulosiruptor morganii]|uniref:Transcription-repair-coupling factor n=1 Tax=Caldicellulosiruptor morganii TaxID=1387555 RepID=A0ABY7BQ28_9FIRM|nr:transcription-repair coupling factor [Caldicellulosiruptor morganii]WAM33519.1 transcription-repair coupling factor [Caldicellulosiruptor morganii]
MLRVFEKLDEFLNIARSVSQKNLPILAVNLGEMGKALLVQALCQKFNKKVLFITHQKNKLEWERRFKNLFDRVVVLQERENPLINSFAKSKDSDIQRAEEFVRIFEEGFDVLVLSPQNLLEKYADFKFEYITLEENKEMDFTGFLNTISRYGYERVKVVERKGQFSQKGGIIDIYPVASHYPIRVEFFGDTIDTIRYFDVETQKSFERISLVKIYKACEWDLNIDFSDGLKKVEADFKKLQSKLKGDAKKNLEESFKDTIDGLDLKIDRLYPYYYQNFKTIFDIFDDCLIVIDEYNQVYSSLKSFEEHTEEVYKDLLEKGYILPGMAECYFKVNEILAFFSNSIILQTFTQSIRELQVKSIFSFNNLREIPSYNASKSLLIDDIKYYLSKGYTINIFAGSATSLEDLRYDLEKNEIEFRLTDKVSESEKGVFLLAGSIEKGVEIEELKWVCLSFFNFENKKIKDIKKRPKSKKEAFYTIEDLKTGSYVVHRMYGIGRFLGFEKITVEGVTKEYLKLEYANNSYLYVPTTNLDVIEKYIGTGDLEPKLSKLGSLEWQKQKQKVRKSLEVVAKDIVELYAKRQLKKGFKFSPDTVWQKEFEEKFPYAETEGQLQAIEEIKKDMESEKPMDRILCGDVGYGKTEVAMRAAFKAVMDSKQVALLVPTTILAHQHYMTFVQRMKDFPITIEVLSRLKTERQQKKILKGLKEGTIDIIIGTHRLLSNDVKFKDLGLLIIDEEHKFGVEHKEKIKKLKENVDVLTLTATPIPRTLNMALLGIRDLSIIEDPPEDRFPVQTFVMEYNEKVIKEAILKEILRGGQVFYLYNRVKDIEEVVNRLEKLLGEGIKIAFAHGRMDERQLEEVLIDFINGKYDVLVTTTIIESGVDMPNVNTLIVEDADRLGLAQLYQLRGRVGRSNKLAYAYFTFRKDKVLSEEAAKRLAAIKEFTELGSGFRIAMRDLEIRGAGSIVGKLQHGHINAVGYDMYIRLLSEEIRRLKGENVQPEIEPQIDIKISAYISSEYIDDDRERINMYKKISSIEKKEDAEEIYEELIDRFGDVPKEVDNLIKIAYIKCLCKKLGIVGILQVDEQKVKLQFVSQEAAQLFKKFLSEIKILYAEGRDCSITFPASKDILDFLVKTLEDITEKVALPTGALK